MTNLGREVSFAKKAWPGALRAFHVEQLSLLVMKYQLGAALLRLKLEHDLSIG